MANAQLAPLASTGTATEQISASGVVRVQLGIARQVPAKFTRNEVFMSRWNEPYKQNEREWERFGSTLKQIRSDLDAYVYDPYTSKKMTHTTLKHLKNKG